MSIIKSDIRVVMSLPIPKIYDTVIFFDETDLFDLRFTELRDTVDCFIVVESKYTFTNKPKPLYFDCNKYNSPQVLHMVIEEFPSHLQNAWDREGYQRNYITDYIRQSILPSDPITGFNDIIMFSDVDEIPSREFIESLKSGFCTPPLVVEMDFYYYNFNWLQVQKWMGTVVIRKQYLLDNRWITNQNLRSMRRDFLHITEENSGWHLSYFKHPEDIVRKIESWSHDEFNKKEYKDIRKITHLVNNGKDLFSRPDVEFIKAPRSKILPIGYDQLPDYMKRD